MINQVDTIVVKNNTPIQVIDVSDLWNNPVTIISMISICIAILALFSPIIVDYISKKIRLKKLKTVIRYLIEMIIVHLNRYTEDLDKLKNQIIDPDNIIIEIPLIDEGQIKGLENIDHKDFHEMFATKQKYRNPQSAKHLSDILKVSRWVRFNAIMQKEFSKFLSDLIRYDNKLRDNVNFILRGYDEYLSKLMVEGNKYTQDEFLVEFRKLLSDWRKNKERNKNEIIKNVLLDKLKKICIEYFSHPESTRFLGFIIEANDAYLNLETIREIYEKYVEDIMTSLKSDVANLENAISYYYD